MVDTGTILVKAYHDYPTIFKALFKSNRIDAIFFRDIEIYMEFKKMEKETPGIMKRQYKLAIKMDISVDTVRRAIKSFE